MNEPTREEAIAAKDQVTGFSQKDMVVKSCTPVKSSACPAYALYQLEGDFDLWDNVDEERRKITRQNQHSSPFLRLGPELRNAIYILVLGNRTYRFHDAISRQYAKLRTNGERHILALLSVCHQIYSEASLLPYSLNTFSFRETEISLTPFLLHRRLAHFRAIKSIELITFRAAQMWADTASHSIFNTLRHVEIMERLPNLRQIRVVVDPQSNVYGSGSTMSIYGIAENQQRFEREIRSVREDVEVRFVWI